MDIERTAGSDYLALLKLAAEMFPGDAELGDLVKKRIKEETR